MVPSEPALEPLVVTGSRSAARALSWSGAVVTAMGLFLGGNGIVALVVYSRTVDLSDPFWQAVRQPWSLVGPALDIGCLFGLSAYQLLSGATLLADSWRLRQFHLVVDHRGVSADTRPGSLVPWEEIRHVMVSRGGPYWRRLLIDDGAAPAWWWWEPRVRAGRALLRQHLGRHPVLVNVPIGRLDTTPDVLLRAIHHYSGGRFPDRPVVPPLSAR